MDWMALIMMIIQIIMQFFGGTNDDVVPPEAALRTASAYTATCLTPRWDVAPSVRSNVFSGKIEVVCDVTTAGVGNLGTLETALHAKTAAVAESAQPVAYGRQDGVAYVARLKRKGASVRGRTVLTSDGYSELRRTFSTSGADAAAASRYLKNLETSMEVTANLRPGRYRVVFTSSASVDRPLLVSSQKFYDLLKAEMEKKAASDAKSSVGGIANNL